MKTIALDKTTGDFLITDRRFQVEKRFGHALALYVRNALSVVRHEFALDEAAGFPYYPFVLGVKAPDLGAIRSLFVSYLLGLQGVALVDITCTLQGRNLAIEGYVIGDDGTRVQLLDGQVFVDGERV